jgi:transcription-repair coupling factor (superfamily II helicase)
MIPGTNTTRRIPPLNPALPTRTETGLVWQDLSGCGDSLALAEAVKREKRLYLIVTEDSQTALRLENEIEFFLGSGAPVLHFPDWEILPYDIFSPLPEIVSERLRTLSRLARIEHGILITPVATLMQRLAPRSHVLANTFALQPGQRLSVEETRQRLESVGYQCVSQVLQHGEFAVRGSIIDIFPMGSAVPYRIDLFDEEIESLRTFDTETQRSLEKVKEINLFPAREFPFDEETIKRFRRAFRVHFSEGSANNPLYQDVSKGIAPGGIEYYLPLFVESTETLFDYLPGKTTVVLHHSIPETAAAFFGELHNRYRQRQSHIDRPPLPPELLYLDTAALAEHFNRFPCIRIAPPGSEPAPPSIGYACRQPPQVSLDLKQKQPAAALLSLIKEINGKTLLVAETPGHREALLDTLKKLGIRPKVVETWQDFLDSEAELFLAIAPLELGLWITEPPLAIITEAQLSGEKAQQRRRRRAATERGFEQILRNLEELEIGSPVVHQDHGIGRYLGLVKLTVGGIETEFLALEYAHNDKLYVPVSSLHLISRYSGANPETAPLYKLGGEQWAKAKRRAMERVRDVAAELLDVYAKRAAQQGLAYQTVTEEYAAFAAGFPFEETPDQENAIAEVIKDMASPKPMDRVICGDVGFGKTEVAMRAAFIAAQNSRQVAILVPTTLLAQQHFQNFRDRFADWPVRVEVVSRFVGRKQQEQLMEDLAAGRIDILIGTHKILQKDVRFKNLGLVIVDEEHRFGVTQKEHFKKLRAELDFLTLTATPIPRTLNMAMAGLRDISIIATPPPNRHAIKTFISEWDDALIQEAILREIKRGGQVYVLHNKIETMEKTARDLEKLVPVARIRIAHGQMPERELERIMLDFYHQRFNLLICTTIIESGIDVPSANTILIQRADLLGLAQLHQIRGRVGRSHHRAYAYLLVPPRTLMTADAIKRLEAIEASGELGAGFILSSHDLEIRGAGELLGDEQSGQIQEIGLSLYTELLDEAVRALKSGKPLDLDRFPHETGPEIDLQSPALIPDTYLPDVHTRLVLYKRIANAKNEGDLRTLQVEMIDRFGLLPPPTKTLFAITDLKLKAEKLGIHKIEAGATGGRLLFTPNPEIDPAKVIRLIQTQPQTYKLDGPDRLKFFAPLDAPEKKIEFIDQLLTVINAE